MLKRFAWLCIFFLISGSALAADPTLQLGSEPQARPLSRADLLANPAVRTITVPADVAYQRDMQYRALPLTALVPGLEHAGSIQFTASDGFVANIPGALLAGPGQAWLAIEPANAPWPALKPGGPSAGPFYLVWLTPGKSAISPEQWPYQIAKIAAALPLEQRFPQLAPKTAADSAERRGMQVFIANCAVCHRLNRGGDAAIGPDLNVPWNPTDYFHEDFLRRLIRDPGSVRNWPQRAMPGFAPSVMSEEQLDHLLAYLRQMAKQR